MKTETGSKNYFETPYDAGYNAGMFGANTKNSHFGWFNTKENMLEWSRGNKDGSAKRESMWYDKKRQRP